MSRTMNQKAATKKKKRTSKHQAVEAPPELTSAEKLFEKIKPHVSTIALVVVAGVLGFIVIAFIVRNRFDSDAMQWRELNNASAIALRTRDVNGLKQVAANNPDTKAGLWALQMAGDHQLRMGLEQLSDDREAGLALIRKSRENFQSVVDAPSSAKTTMLQRRSHFSFAYACESLGQFAEAKTLYQELVDEAPDSAFANPARRGITRCSNEDYAELYTKFIDYEEVVIGDAPGPPIPDRPRIDEFPKVDLPPGQKPPTGNDFVPPVTDTPEKSNNEPENGSTGDENPTGDESTAGDASKADTDKADEKKAPVSDNPPTEKPADKPDVDPKTPEKSDGNDQ